MASQGIYHLIFFSSVGLFFYLYKPHLGYPEETVGQASVKIIPILTLIVWLFNTETTQITSHIHKWHLRGLVFSMLGDISLVWRTKYFIAGMIFFGIAQTFYVIAFGFHKKRPFTALVCIVAGSTIDFYILPGIKETLMKYLVVTYTVLIFTMIWRAFDRYVSHECNRNLYGLIGAIIFAASDLIIAVDKWSFPISGSSAYVMITYYLAQFLIALSVHLECKATT